MIRVSLLFPNQLGSTFDQNYFADKHIQMAKQRLEGLGLVGVEIDRGISAADPNSAAPFVAVAHFTFNSVDEVHTAFKAVGREVMGDIPNYTNIQPQVQISEIIE